MKKISTFLLAFSTFFVVQAQSWQWLNPLPQGNTLNAVSAVDSLHCFSVGGYGTVMKTSNGGASWTILNIGTTEQLTGVIFTDTLTGWIISKNGKILHTNDAGTSWNIQYSDPDASYLTSLAFTSRLHGCVVGGGIDTGYPKTLTTWDGGVTWVMDSMTVDSLLFATPIDVSFPDSLHGWFIAGSDIYITRDAGASWNHQHNFGWPVWFQSLSFVDTLHGWASEGYSNRLYRTTDEGATWSVQTFPWYPAKVCFINPSTGYVGGFNSQGGIVRKTTDGGLTWTSMNPLGMNFLNGLGFSDSVTGWAVGTSGAIFKTSGSNPSWTEQTFEYTHENLSKCSFLANGQLGWAAGSKGKVIHSTDFGYSWTSQETGVTDGLVDIDFPDPLHGWACGGYGLVIATTDGGSTWTKMPVPTHKYCRGLSFPTADIGFIVCDSGILLSTHDAGLHWDRTIPSDNDDLFGVYFVDNLNGWITAMPYPSLTTNIFRTTDGGIHWSPAHVDVHSIFYSIFFTDTENGWAVGQHSAILKTTDGGISWEIVNCNCLEDFISVYFRDPDHGVIGGSNGILMRSYDGGSSWEKVESGNDGNLMSLYINGGENCWSVGSNGCILKYSDVFTGIPVRTGLKKEVDVTVAPNPFSDKTVISYFLDRPQKVVITLFSINGSTLKTLVNEEQAMGKHKFSFSDPQLKPGVYLCQLRNGTNTQTVKLIIVPSKE